MGAQEGSLSAWNAINDAGDHKVDNINERVPLTVEDHEWIQKMGEKRDHRDADYQQPSPRKRHLHEEPPSSSPSKKKGKLPATLNGNDSVVPLETWASAWQSRNAAKEKLIGMIKQHWGEDHNTWPTIKHISLKSGMSIVCQVHQEPEHWGLDLLEDVERLARAPDPHGIAGGLIDHFVKMRKGRGGRYLLAKDARNAAISLERGNGLGLLGLDQSKPSDSRAEKVGLITTKYRPVYVEDEIDVGDTLLKNIAKKPKQNGPLLEAIEATPPPSPDQPPASLSSRSSTAVPLPESSASISSAARPAIVANSTSRPNAAAIPQTTKGSPTDSPATTPLKEHNTPRNPATHPSADLTPTEKGVGLWHTIAHAQLLDDDEGDYAADSEDEAINETILKLLRYKKSEQRFRRHKSTFVKEQGFVASLLGKDVAVE
ncbi:hypothetical protein Slin15195_G126190 [Septoria linicola]|uniref:Uncharacterized protein n=1 Tax=Septoria linicola TaxID=215465 RepID=A0A9Q9B275_9PEZI|nr:hypothetical protein Slin14017_G082370 [Septoria linicola]USW59300.1 hypothetical protein Slin15195_G126190 [Septoria linicola]